MLLRRTIAPAAIALALAAILTACDDEKAASPPAPSVAASPLAATPTRVPLAPPGPATFTIIAGDTDGPIDIEQFMPSFVHIREGDTVEWTSSSIEAHTITFATAEQQRAIVASFLVRDPEDPEQQLFNPQAELRTDSGATFDGDGSFVNSGSIGAVGTEGIYRLTFTRRGVYEYLCLIHPFVMRGIVSVDAINAQVESPDAVAARGRAEFERFVEEEKRAVEQAREVPRDMPGPDGTRVYRVAVGLATPHGQAAYFIPPKLDIKTGDTVIFENDERNFHNVIFKGSRANFPPGIAVRADPAGRGVIFGLAKESALPADPPSGGFDASTYLSSGAMGVLLPRMSWRLTFDKPGTYVYNCTIHAFAGMSGVIVVTQR